MAGAHLEVTDRYLSNFYDLSQFCVLKVNMSTVGTLIRKCSFTVNWQIIEVLFKPSN